MKLLSKYRKWWPLVKGIAQLSREETKVGAIIFGENMEILSTGYNDFPMGVAEFDDRRNGPDRRRWISHAEENAIALAARSGTQLKGSCIAVSTLFPCSTCARMIIQAGIVLVVSKGAIVKPKWVEEAEVSRQMFDEAGVTVVEDV